MTGIWTRKERQLLVMKALKGLFNQMGALTDELRDRDKKKEIASRTANAD